MGDERSKKIEFISSKIKELRDGTGWSQSEVARQTGISSAAISQIEKGDRMPSLMVLRKLAEIFNISVSELTGDTLKTSESINSDAQIFYRKFGDLKDLNEADQEMIKSIINRLKEEKDDKR